MTKQQNKSSSSPRNIRLHSICENFGFFLFCIYDWSASHCNFTLQQWCYQVSWWLIHNELKMAADKIRKKNLYRNKKKDDIMACIFTFSPLGTGSPALNTPNYVHINGKGWWWWSAKFSPARLVLTQVYETPLHYRMVKAATTVYRVLLM